MSLRSTATKLIFIIISLSAMSAVSSSSYLDSKNLYLRRDLLDTATEFFNGLRNMLIDGDLNQYLNLMNDILDENFIFESDITGITYNGLDHFLDLKDGWHSAIIGTFDSVTSLMGSNIIYHVIDQDTIEMTFPIRTVLWRNQCPPAGPQGITEEEIDVLTFVCSNTHKKWKIYSFIGQGGKTDVTPC